jgi:hypothetical protein
VVFATGVLLFWCASTIICSYNPFAISDSCNTYFIYSSNV